MSETSMLAPPPEWVSIPKWARYYSVHVATAYRLRASGRLPYIDVSAGTKKPNYRVRLDQVPQQPGGSRDESAAAKWNP